MDLIFLIQNLYESNENHILQESEKEKLWNNMLRLLQYYTQTENKQINSPQDYIFLSSCSKEQAIYLDFLRDQLKLRGISLKEHLSEQQMVEAGLGFTLLLIIEGRIEGKEQQQKDQVNEILKVVNYDFFQATFSNNSGFSSNLNEDEQRYEEIRNCFPKYPENNNSNKESLVTNEFVLNTCILFSRVAECFQTESEQYLKIFSPSLSHFFLNMISQPLQSFKSAFNSSNQEYNYTIIKENHLYEKSKKYHNNLKKKQGNKSEVYYQIITPDKQDQEIQERHQRSKSYANNNNKQYHNQWISPKHLQFEEYQNDRYSKQQNKLQKDVHTPLLLKTPDAMRLIETKDDSLEKEHSSEEEKNDNKSVLQESLVQEFNADKLIKKNKKKQMSQQHQRHSDQYSNQSNKLHNNQKRRNESCIQTGNIQFEDSQVVINKLDVEKRRYQLYSLEQSAQIQQLNSLYVDLKKKYDNLLFSIQNDESNKQFPQVQQLPFKRQSEVRQSNEGANYLDSISESTSKLLDNSENISKSEDNYKKQSLLFSNDENAQLLDNLQSSLFGQNSDLHRHLAHCQMLNIGVENNVLHLDIGSSTSQQFNNDSLLISQREQKVEDSSEKDSPLLFNYVEIKGNWDQKKTKKKNNKHKMKKEESYTAAEIISLIFSILVLSSIPLLYAFY